VDAGEDPQRLEPVDGAARQVVPGAALDLGLAKTRADTLGACGERRRLAGKGVRVDGEVDLAHVIEPMSSGVTRATPP
jgi:hypothetical protein